ncbi:uncharacterized protein LOC142916604 isoform X2 [Petromyzon marinus]|uniref:uncharacterized protein LOC142916604 isoform X2 n=1 Tax=Petromyzon marinus TaxID=7757 RepID=UPI003F6EE126
MDNLNTWKVRVDTELDKKEEAVSETLETIDTLQKSTRETQLENEDVSVQLQDVINVKRGSTEKIRATGEMCDDLKCQASSVQQTFTRAEAEKENTEYVNLSRKQETKVNTFAVTLGDLNLKTQNNKNVTLDKVEVAVEEMGRAQWDFTIKLTIKESQVKENSELLELRNEVLKTTSHVLQDPSSNCAGLEGIKRNFPTRLEQAQEEINTLSLERDRRQEVESTLQIQNTESSLAVEEREHTTSTTELQQSRDQPQHEHRDLNVIVQNLEKANEELPEAAGQRCSEEAEIRSRLETNIRGKNTEIDNMTIASDNNNAKHQETLIKDLESEMDSLKRRHEQARNNSAAELADCREQIKHLKEINSRSISAEIEQVKIRAEKTAQFKITEMIAMVEEYKRQCDRNLAAKEKQYCYIGHKHQEALENVQTSNNEMRAEIAKLKEELKQKEGGVDALLRPRAAPQAAVTAGTSAATPATGDGNALAPGSAGDEAPRESSRGFRRRPRERATQTSPLPAPVTAAKSAPEGIREPLATGEMANAKRKLLYWSDSESSEGMDLTVDEQLLESVSGAMPSKRSDKARAAGKNLFDAEGSGDSDDDDTGTIRASEISRKAASTRKVKRGRMISALPPSKPPAIEWGNIFDWFEDPDVYAFEPED